MGSGAGRFATAGVTLALLGTAALAWPSPAGAQASMTGDELIAALQQGTPVEEANLRIVGPLRLDRLGQVPVALRCEDCTITGGVVATDVIFDRSIDLDGVHVEGDVDLRGAVFRGPVLVRGEGDGAGFSGDVNASFATFQDSAGFDGLAFGGTADFTGARFAEEASFAGTRFAGPAIFEQVGFGGLASFNGLQDPTRRVAKASFERPVSFRGATFQGPADLGLRTYREGLTLSNAAFGSVATLAQSDVIGVLEARGAAFADLDARALVVLGRTNLNQARAGTASFDSARFDGEVTLDEMTVSGSTSLRNVQIGESLNMTGFLSARLSMDLDLVEQIEGRPAQEAVLTVIEGSARAAGDNGTANSAEYELLRLQGEAKSGLNRVVDLVLFQWIGGYLVRPSHPLTTLFLLILLGTIVRFVYDRRKPGRPSTRAMGSELNRAGKFTVQIGALSGALLNCLSRALAASLRPKPHIAIPDDARERPGAYLVAGMRLFEYVASKVLILVFLLSMANYNQTLRQLIEGVIQ